MHGCQVGVVGTFLDFMAETWPKRSPGGGGECGAVGGPGGDLYHPHWSSGELHVIPCDGLLYHPHWWGGAWGGIIIIMLLATSLRCEI